MLVIKSLKLIFFLALHLTLAIHLQLALPETGMGKHQQEQLKLFAQPSVPAPPANLRHTNNTASSIAWTWNPSTGATSYNIYIQCQDGETPCYSNEWRFQTTIVNTTYTQTQYFQYLFGLTNLEANTRYGIAVSACNVSGCSGASIATAVCSMPTPNGILCSNITKTSLRATAQTFFPKISNLSSGLYFRETSNSWNSGYIQTPNWDLSQLIPGTVYTFFVKARNQEGDETPEFGPKTCTTLALNIPYSLRTKHPDGSILKLALISVADALLLNNGTIKTRMANGFDYAAYLVATSSPEASPVRVMTPMGIKAWRKAP